MNDTSRLIEHAFPLKQASLDSVHEKNVRHGHISTLHIWPARRPLAACRAALIATLLPDPGTPEKRKELCERIGGKLVKQIESKKMPDGSAVEREKEETEGGILHWLENEPDTKNKKKWKEWKVRCDNFTKELEWFRQEVGKAYGSEAPKVLDPFSGGGAIPLEAMRLGCEATAVDINPVAWFVLKCTLDYPQRLAGKTNPLPDFILEDETFMNDFYKAHPHLVGRTKKTKQQVEADAGIFPEFVKADSGRAPKADLAWHVRAWGRWVLKHIRQDLGKFYPVYADFEPLDRKNPQPYERREMQLVPLKEDGAPDIDALNKDFTPEYLDKACNPRWVAKPTVAYLWARTVVCKNCRAKLPLLKTRWLCKTDRKRVLLKMEPNAEKTSVVFGIETNVPAKGGNAAQKREYDKSIAAGTMSRSGAKCPCCGTIMTMEDIRIEGKAGRLGYVMTSVMADGQHGKEARLPTERELQILNECEATLPTIFENVPFGIPVEPMPNENALGMRVPKYGVDRWHKMFTHRQLAALGTLVKRTRSASQALSKSNYDSNWAEAITSYLACGVDRFIDFANVNVQWKVDADTINHALVRFAIQITWDFAEGNPIGDCAGAFELCINRIATGLDTLALMPTEMVPPHVVHASAQTHTAKVDIVVTDPPYYDAIPYSDLMDWFYVWLRRMLFDLTAEHQAAMVSPLGPKWDRAKHDGELVDDRTRHGGDAIASKRSYEEGMSQAFQRCGESLNDTGRLVIVFANKSPDAWETLVSSVIKAGFIVTGSWPIQTEQPSRMRGISSAALASSVWLVCKKRPATARPGWDSKVLEEMRTNIRAMLREFWDAGIRGPDFVWAATGPAMEAFSKHPIVKKANEPGPLTVSEFLNHVRRMVVDFVVGRVLSGDKPGDTDSAATDRLDEPTAYYLLHRNDFGMDEAPAGACILYAVSCGISDRELAQTWDLIGFTKGKGKDDEDEESDADDASDDEEDDSGGKVKLKTWAQRKGKSLGYEAPGGRPIPLIDRVHCLMHLWKAGDLSKVDGYIDGNGLRRQELFKRLLQSLIELSPHGSEERSLLESLSNHVGARGAVQAGHLEMALDEQTAKADETDAVQ